MKAKWLNNINSWLAPGNWLVNDAAPATPEPDLPQRIEAARQEWIMAQMYYNNVSDPDLVDHAVYEMQAAEKKYIYLLKQAREQGITYSPFTVSQDR